VSKTYNDIKSNYNDCVLLTYDLSWAELTNYRKIRIIENKIIEFSRLVRSRGDVKILK